MRMITIDLPALRARRHLTQRQLAALAGVRQDTISALERGDTAGIQFGTLMRLCEALQCTPGDILIFEPDAEYKVPVLGGPDEDVLIAQRIAELDRAPRVDGPSFLAALMEREGLDPHGPALLAGQGSAPADPQR